MIYLQSQGLIAAESERWSELYERLQRYPPTADTVNLLAVLNRCYRSSACHFLSQQLQQAYLTRPINSRNRANALRALRQLQG